MIPILELNSIISSEANVSYILAEASAELLKAGVYIALGLRREYCMLSMVELY
jgi:hypothetical protein